MSSISISVVMRVCHQQGFHVVGTDIINLDLRGNTAQVMRKLLARKRARDGASFSPFEKMYLPIFINTYRSLWPRYGGLSVWNEAPVQ